MRTRLKLLPIFIMLIAGAFTSIITYVLNYEGHLRLWILVGVLVLFYILGLIIQKVIHKFETEIAEEEARLAEEEGKVLEKEAEEGEASADGAAKKPESKDGSSANSQEAKTEDNNETEGAE